MSDTFTSRKHDPILSIASPNRRVAGRRLLGACAFPFLVAAAAPAVAQAYPDRPVKVVVTTAPGGALDVTARLVADKLSAKLGKTFVVENRSGAGGVVGAASVAKAQPDGYTLMFVSAGFSMLPALHRSLPFTHADFTPVAVAVSVPYFLVTGPNAPYKTLPEFIAYAKSNPGKLSFASGGNNTSGHLIGMWFKSEAGIDLLHVPFKGEGPGVQAMLGDQVSMMPVTVSSGLPLVKAGKLRALAVSSGKRSSVLPDVPTIAEQGVPVQSATWFGMLAPAGVPKEIVDKLNDAVNRSLAEPDMRERFMSTGMEIESRSPEAFKELIEHEAATWARVIKESGIKPAD